MKTTLTRAEKHRKIVALQGQGLSRTEIAPFLHLSVSGIASIITDPDGSKQKARRERYRGECITCGKKTDGSSGYGKAPRYCAGCRPDVDRIWTRENVITAIQRWARVHGRPPSSREWLLVGDDHPGMSSVYPELFPSWADAIEAAGFPRPRSGAQQGKWWTPEAIVEMIREFVTTRGRRPSVRDWRDDPAYPDPKTVARTCGSWADAIEMAGYERPIPGRHITPE